MDKITPETLVPLSLMGVLIGGIFWLSSMSIKSSIVYAKVDKLEEANSKQSEDNAKFQREVIERLARIEEALRMGK